MTATMQEPAAPPTTKEAPASVPVAGIIDVVDGHAFARTSGYRASPADVYVSAGQIRKYGLRKGDRIEGAARTAASRGKFSPLASVDTVNGMPLELAKGRPVFDDLTPLYPQQRLRLEDGSRRTPRGSSILFPRSARASVASSCPRRRRARR